MQSAEERLTEKGIKPTANRILVMQAIMEACAAVSLADLEAKLETLDRSSIFRALTLFLDKHAAHAIYDGSGSIKYEACESHDLCSHNDMHVHFYCRRCQRTICLRNTTVPHVQMPEGYRSDYINYTIVGLCEKCNH